MILLAIGTGFLVRGIADTTSHNSSNVEWFIVKIQIYSSSVKSRAVTSRNPVLQGAASRNKVSNMPPLPLIINNDRERSCHIENKPDKILTIHHHASWNDLKWEKRGNTFFMVT